MPGTGPAPLPDTPEAVALELMRIVAKAEGRPLENITENRLQGSNKTVRAYILELYVECLLAARAEIKEVVRDSGTH